MGSIRKRNSQWNAQVRIKGWRSLSKTFATKQLAEAWVRQTEDNVRHAALTTFQPKVMSLQEACTRYAATISSEHKGFVSEQHRLRYFGNSCLGATNLHDLSQGQLQAYFDQRGLHVSRSTLRREMLLLKRVLTTAMTEWQANLTTHPMRQIKIPKDNPHRVRRITDDEWERILKTARLQRNSLIADVIEFARETGMRRSEILSIESKQIDVEQQIAFLPDTKNGSHRSVALSQRAIDIIMKHSTADLLFPISATALQQAWQRILRKTNITNLRFHDLRHEAISRFFEMGMTIAEVQSLSGHKDVRQLFNYTHMQASNIASKYFKLKS